METQYSHIGTDELIDDYNETIVDIRLCELALSVGAETFDDGKGNVRERLQNNRKMLVIIRRELAARDIFTLP